MGVLGLVPFLQKRCPQVFTTLPDRISAISGKTLAIDGTLVTQRLHWAPLPHRYRHVLGWYKLVNELKSSRVGAVCVFDGPYRTAAKAMETERRRFARRQVISRSTIEAERLCRLRRLSSLLQAYKTLPMDERLQKSETLKAFMAHVQTQTVQQDVDAPELWTMWPEVDVEGIPVTNSSLPEVPETYELWADYDGVDNSMHLYDRIYPDELGFPVTYGQPSTRTLVDEIADLYRDYHLSSHGLASMTVTPKIKSPFDGFTTNTLQDFTTESKLQALLTQEEGQLWSALVSSVAQPTDEETSASTILSDLASRSQFLYESYGRRSRPPSPETYEESKMILRAMGIPYVECDGPYEAEALATSLVLRGRADYVASEDTDVLVYGAPMLRNLTTRNLPLSLISSADIPSALHLSRASFVDFALLLGTDFSRRIKNVGPTRALKLLQIHTSIEEVLEKETQYIGAWNAETTATYLAGIELARLVFAQLPEVPANADLNMRETDGGAVLELLERFELRREAAEEGWDFRAPLAGNYFHDSPFAGVPAY